MRRRVRVSVTVTGAYTPTGSKEKLTPVRRTSSCDPPYGWFETLW